MTHHIKRQILELELPRRQGATDLQRRASRVLQEKVLPKLDEVFSRLAPEGTVLRIEKLDLDLGNLPENGWENVFAERCFREIEKAVSAKHSERVSQTAPPETLTESVRRLEVLRQFLDTGILPWFAKHEKLEVLERQLLQLLEGSPAGVRLFLLPVFRQNALSLRRLFFQFSEKTAEQTLETVFETLPGFFREAVGIFEKEVENGGFPKGEVLPPGVFIAEQLVENQKLATVETAKLALQKLFPNFQKTELPKVQDSEKLNQKPSNLPSIKPENPRNSERPALDEIFISDAGLVLLGAYLESFFKHLGLVQGSDFVHENARQRAVHLLHFLVSGEEMGEEPALVFPKILCGLPLETPVLREIPLLEVEKRECSELLEAVVQNWPALKNTGVAGFRNAFLVREGKISWQEARQTWLLQVERRGTDVLLDRLPWGFSVLRFSWMEAMVSTEW